MKRLFFILIFVAGCVMHPNSGWRIYDAGPFTITLPNGMQKTSLHGIDTYAEAFQSANMYLTFDYGPNSGFNIEYQRVSDMASHKERIDGKDVNIISFHRNYPYQYEYAILISFDDKGLSVLVNCKKPEDFDLAVKIFKTIKFKPTRQ